MKFPTSDPGFLGAIIGAISGLLGALIGGLATYLASTRQYRIEYQTRLRAALVAALIEICRNHPTLFNELDRVLPLWLSRKHDSITAKDHLKEVTSQIPRYHTRVHDNFFIELITSKFGSEIKTYYDKIIFINELSIKNTGGLNPSQFPSYVTSLAISIEAADALAKEIHRYCKKEIIDKWGKDDYFGFIEEVSDRSLYMTALTRTKLSDIEIYLKTGVAPPSIRIVITRKDKNSLFPWIIPAREL